MLMSEAVGELQRLIAEVGDLPLCFSFDDEVVQIEEFQHYDEAISRGFSWWKFPAYVRVYGEQPMEYTLVEKPKDEFADVKKIPCRLSDLEVRPRR